MTTIPVTIMITIRIAITTAIITMIMLIIITTTTTIIMLLWCYTHDLLLLLLWLLLLLSYKIQAGGDFRMSLDQATAQSRAISEVRLGRLGLCSVWMSPGDHHQDSGGCSTRPVWRGWGTGSCSAWREDGLWRTYQQPCSAYGEVSDGMETASSQRCVVGINWNERLRWHTRRTLFTLRAVKQGNVTKIKMKLFKLRYLSS